MKDDKRQTIDIVRYLELADAFSLTAEEESKMLRALVNKKISKKIKAEKFKGKRRIHLDEFAKAIAAESFLLTRHVILSSDAARGTSHNSYIDTNNVSNTKERETQNDLEFDEKGVSWAKASSALVISDAGRARLDSALKAKALELKDREKYDGEIIRLSSGEVSDALERVEAHLKIHPFKRRKNAMATLVETWLKNDLIAKTYKELDRRKRARAGEQTKSTKTRKSNLAKLGFTGKRELRDGK